MDQMLLCVEENYIPYTIFAVSYLPKGWAVLISYNH